MKKYYFTLKSNSQINQIGSCGIDDYWTDNCNTKKEVKQKYSSKSCHGRKVIAVYTEEQYIEKFGKEETGKIKRYWLA